MANYAKMAREAADRRRALESDLEKARRTVKECEKELAVLSQILGALKGVKPARGGGPKGKRRKGGKWKPGKPGRPPKWYVEQQKAGGGKKKGRKRRGRKPGRRAAPKPAVSAPTEAAPPTV